MPTTRSTESLSPSPTDLRAEPSLIDRPRLLEKLDNSPARIIALIAPAGYGKTTLARQWISSRSVTHAWYQVGPEGFDVAAVAARIATAVSTLIPGAGEKMMIRLGVSSDPEAEAVLLAEMLAKGMDAWPASARLVIDDYQVLAVSHACERFLETLVHETPVRLLITSRKRPSWAHSRLRLYGELVEIRRDELVMTPEESGQVLAPILDDQHRADLIDLCHGWPAVLGLAARTNAALPKDALPRDLYDYFAEEMFQNAPPELQRFLCQVSIAPRITKALLDRLVGLEAMTLASTAEKRGFFDENREELELSLHPLLRTFLKRRLDERSDRYSLINHLAGILLESECWDEVWELIQDRERLDLLPKLIERSLPTLLDGNRVPALESWIDFGRDHSMVSPLLDLAEAEVAFLSGNHAKAYELGVQATAQFDQSSSLLWRGHAIAARSAHFSDRLTIGLKHAREGRLLSRDIHAKLHCLWIEFLCAYELELDECFDLFLELQKNQEVDLESTARVINAMHLLANLSNFNESGHIVFDRLLGLIDRLHPQISALYLFNYGEFLTQSARYAEGETILEQSWALLEDFNIQLGFPSGYCARAENAIGLRRYRHADLLLEAAESYAGQSGSIATHIRTLKTLSSFLKKNESLSGRLIEVESTSSKCWRGLAYAVDALRSACNGDDSFSLTWTSKAESTTKSTEVLSLTAFIRTILAHRASSASALTYLRKAIAIAEYRCRWNQFIWAYRAYPELLALSARDDELIEKIRPVLISAHDYPLAERHGISIPNRDQHLNPKDQLSKREREVLRLLAEGLSNKAIANRLFISDVTVKVHLRHIYKKLGARSRVDAARKTVYLSLD